MSGWRIEYSITVERALSLHKAIGGLAQSEEELNDFMGNGRSSSIIDVSLLNKDELVGLKDANFLRKPNNWQCICLLIVKKETYPGNYFLSEC